MVVTISKSYSVHYRQHSGVMMIRRDTESHLIIARLKFNLSYKKQESAK